MPKALVLGNEVVQIEMTEFEVHSDLTWHDVGNDVEVGWTLADGTFSAPVAVTPAYDEARRRAYPDIGEQLDLLWHAIDAGNFGEPAKTSSFYTTLQTVKTNNPAPSE
jgi:hypothetical protein